MKGNESKENNKPDNSLEYIGKFSEYLKKAESGKVLYLLKELLSHINQVCIECESDRIRCMLRPICGKSRPYLSIRLELGYATEVLPQFCLKQHLNYFSNFLKNKIKGPLYKDVKITVNQFLLLLDGIKPLSLFIPPMDQVEELFKIILRVVKNILPEAEIYPGHIHSYIHVFNSLIHINMKSGIVNLNPTDEPITSEEELKKLIDVYSRIYDLKVEIIEEMYGFWYLDFFIKKLESGKPLEKEEMEILNFYRQKLESRSDYTTYTIIENELHCIIDIPTPGKTTVNRMLNPGVVNYFFKIIADSRKILKEKFETPIRQ
ncbi:MAG: hypothetical protein QW327_03050 [Candidatus Odinarchaeota archaeon]